MLSVSWPDINTQQRHWNIHDVDKNLSNVCSWRHRSWLTFAVHFLFNFVWFVIVSERKTQFVLNLKQFVLNLTQFVLNLTKFFLNLTQFLLNLTKFLPNLTQFVLKLTQFVLNLTQFVLNLIQYVLNLTQYELNLTHFVLNVTQFVLNLTQYSLNLKQFVQLLLATGRLLSVHFVAAMQPELCLIRRVELFIIF
jgi:hypothetical protein